LCSWLGRVCSFSSWRRIAPHWLASRQNPLPSNAQQAWQIVSKEGRLPWRQTRAVDGSISSNHLKRAVIVSEDDIFAQHDGVQRDAIEKSLG
jgi:membrane peptidoglycan carboxypeptidase